jgi:hypothetical protein
MKHKYTIACVCKTGREYTPEHVDILQNMVKRHVKVPYEFVCVSDVKQNCRTVLFEQDFPGWWSKIELFRKGIFSGKVLFMDLDTIVCGNITDYLTKPQSNRLYMMTEFDYPKEVSSCFMAWDTDKVDLSHLYNNFIKNPARFMQHYDNDYKPFRGDQLYISKNQKFDRINSLSSQKIMSYRVHYAKQKVAPQKDVSLVAFGGKRRPWILKDTVKWIAKEYR